MFSHETFEGADLSLSSPSCRGSQHERDISVHLIQHESQTKGVKGSELHLLIKSVTS